MDFFKSSKKLNPFARTTPHSNGQSQAENYAPPPGPPPSQQRTGHNTQSAQSADEVYSPPPGPPPSSLNNSNNENPPPYHDWQSVPDTALLPPPPSLSYDFSPASNASEEDANIAQTWCDHYPLMRPHQPSAAHISAVRTADIGLQKPMERGTSSIRELGTGRWNISTSTRVLDSCFISSLPLFFVTTDSPLYTERTKTIYYEIKIKSLHTLPEGDQSVAAIGFCAVPYPMFRLPGWERGSFAVHSDDGNRYTNDNEGGKQFAGLIAAGETVGLGVRFSLRKTSNSHYHGNELQGEVFFTRNGHKRGGWDIHEQLDEKNNLGVFGVDGTYDLFAAIGIFGKVSLEVSFNSRDWLWKP